MRRLAYRLLPSSRLSAGRTGEVLQGKQIHQVIPGSVIRGALGWAWWKSPEAAYRGANARAAFDRLFGRLLEVGDAVPALRTESGVTGAVLRSLSAVEVKYPGDRTPPEGWHDLAPGPLEACPACGLGWAEPRGWSRPVSPCDGCGTVFEQWKRGWDVPGWWVTPTTRTKLSDGIAQDEQLFTRLAMTRRVEYHGTLVLREETPELDAALEWLSGRLPLRVGGQRSTLGAVTWSSAEAAPVALPTTERVVLRLRSTALLVDGLGAPSFDLAGALRAVPGAGAVARVWTRPGQVGGWHGVAGVPKPIEWGLSAGSVAVLDGWDAEALARVGRGLGLRRLEGFGAVELLAVDDLDTFGSRSPQAQPPDSGPATAPDAPQPSAGRATTPTAAEAEQNEWLAHIAGFDQRAINGLLSAARHIAAIRQTRMSGPVVAFNVKETLDKPWCRELGPDSRSVVERVLKSADIAALVTRIERLRHA